MSGMLPSKNLSEDLAPCLTTTGHTGPHGLGFIWLIKKMPVICYTALYEYVGLGAHDRPFDVFVEKSSDLANLKYNVEKLIGNA